VVEVSFEHKLLATLPTLDAIMGLTRLDISNTFLCPLSLRKRLCRRRSFGNCWHYQQLNRYKGSGGNKKLPPRRIPTVGTVQKVLSTGTQLTHKHHHHGGAVCPSYGVVSLDTPDRARVTSSGEGSGKGKFTLGLVQIVKITA